MKLVKAADNTGEVLKSEGGNVEFRPIVKERHILANVVSIFPRAEVYGENHKHDDHEMLYVISGDGIIYSGKKATAFESGDTVVFEPNEPHWFAFGNAGAKVLELKWM